MADLYPTFPVPDIASSESETEAYYPSSVFFDFEKGDFSVDSTGCIKVANGIEAWQQWCLIATQTQRFAFLGYGNGFGIEAEEAFAEPTRKEQEAALETTITNAIMADPYHRTLYVRDFEFTWGTDDLHVTFYVVGHEGNIAKIEATLTGG